MLFLLACRTADLISGNLATPTRTRATRAALRSTFTVAPTETDTPEPTEPPPPTDTPAPTQPPPTKVPTRPPPTRRPPTPRPPTATPRPPTAIPSPTTFFEWTASNPSCESATNADGSAVVGRIMANNKAAIGQYVQASSGPGGEPISEVPTKSDNSGNYKVLFVCGSGKNCNGDFWVWMVDSQRRQVSPFVKTSFSGSCQRYRVNFTKR